VGTSGFDRGRRDKIAAEVAATLVKTGGKKITGEKELVLAA